MRRAAAWWLGPAREVEDRLFRWLALLRVVLLADAVVNDVRHLDEFDRPGLAVGCVLLMVAWTGVMAWAYLDQRRRHAPVLVADLVVAVVLVLVTGLVKGAHFDSTIPGYWVVGATLAWAIRYRWLGGLVAAGAVAGADLSIRASSSQVNRGNIFLLLVGGPVVGLMAESLQRLATERDRAERAAAASAERDRLARVVHDGVLQVLALVQRRGAELGGDAAELARLAGEQERVLRLLVQEQEADEPGTGTADLAVALGRLGSRPRVEVAVPGTPVLMPVDTVTELVAVVTACLDNVTAHAGPDARAWVLVEAWPDRVEVAVRDDGPGIAGGRLEAARADGRLGVSQSIRGRVHDLGGTATLTTGRQGTDWAFLVPRRP